MRFESREKSLLEKFVHLKRKILQFLIFEAKHINSEEGKVKLRRFKQGPRSYFESGGGGGGAD